MPRTQQVEVPDDINPAVLTSPFIIGLCRLRTGDLALELSDDICKAVQACQNTGKKAKLQLTLTMKPNGHGKVVISDEPKITLPRPEQGATSLFTTEHGQLLPHDPAQMEMELRTVNFPQPQVRTPEVEPPTVRKAK